MATTGQIMVQSKPLQQGCKSRNLKTATAGGSLDAAIPQGVVEDVGAGGSSHSF